MSSKKDGKPNFQSADDSSSDGNDLICDDKEVQFNDSNLVLEKMDLMKIDNSDLVHQGSREITFAQRPGWVCDQPWATLHTTELLTNHALVHLPKETITLYCYNVDLYSKEKLIRDRKIAGPLFHSIVRRNKHAFPCSDTYIFNDVNLLWTSVALPNTEGTVEDLCNKLVFTFISEVDFGQTIRDNQNPKLLKILIDAIATARVRSRCSSYTVFKKCMFIVQDVNENPDEFMSAPLSYPLRYGMDVRCGISIGARLNLRAGITACFDVAHTIFNRPGYPIIRLICELINNEPITDDDFEDVWDDRLRNAVVTEENRMVLNNILSGMKLSYAVEKGLQFFNTGKPNVTPMLYASQLSLKSKHFELMDGSAAETRFEDEKRRTWTVAEHYLKTHNIRLRYPNLPCILKTYHENRKMIVFPLEFVSYSRKPAIFSGHIAKEEKTEAANFAAATLPRRGSFLQKIVKQTSICGVPPIIDNEDQYMTKYALRVEKQLLSVKGTVLIPPTMLFGGGSTFTDQHHTGEWKALNNVPTRKVLEDSIVVQNADKNAPKLKKRILGSIMHVGKAENGRVELDFDPACYHRIMRAVEMCGQPVAWEYKEMGQAAIQGIFHYSQGEDNQDKLESFLEDVNNEIDKKNRENDDEVLIPFVLVVFQEKNVTNEGTDYNKIKLIANVMKGVPTQGICLDKLSCVDADPMNCEISKNLVEKILAKVGTTHRKLARNDDHPAWKKFTDPENSTLVLGIDVSHPSSVYRKVDDIRSCSVATIVGNINADCTQFRATSRIQKSGEKMSSELQKAIHVRLDDFIQNTGSLPKHIVVYRDGISESDFEDVLSQDTLAIELCCSELNENWTPTITYIVATRLHGTRFFVQNNSSGTAEKELNVLPGTLIEDTVTTNKYYDFFLTTTAGKAGLSHPTHYYVLRDTWNPSPDFWPNVTNAFTYLFSTFNSTFYIPAPIGYAHSASTQARRNIDGAYNSKKLNEELSENYRISNSEELTKLVNSHRCMDGMSFV